MRTPSPRILAGLVAGIGVGLLVCLVARHMRRAPHLQIAREHDLGEIQHGEQRRISVEFRNTGNEALRIERVAAGCSCMVVDLPRRDYQPGESGRLEFDLLSARLPGEEFEQTAVVYSNDPRAPVQHLVFRARMAPAICTSPAALRVRDVPVGGQWTRDLLVVGVGREMEFAIRGVSSDVEGLVFKTVRLEGDGKLETGQSIPRKYEIVVHQPSVKEVGEFDGHIWIDTTNRRFQRLTVPVSLHVPSAFGVVPKLLFLRPGDMRSGGDATETLTISSPKPVGLVLRPQGAPIRCESETVAPAAKWIFVCRCTARLSRTTTGLLRFDVVGYPPESSIEVPFVIVVD
jgi:hypothetical protein